MPPVPYSGQDADVQQQVDDAALPGQGQGLPACADVRPGEVQQVGCGAGGSGDLLPLLQLRAQLGGDPGQLRAVDGALGVGVGGGVQTGP